MTYRNDKARVAISAAAMLILGCAWPLAAGAADVNSPDRPIACGDFQRGVNGSWTVVHATTIQSRGVAMNLSAGQVFAKNQWVGGIEVTTVLDRNCGNE